MFLRCWQVDDPFRPLHPRKTMSRQRILGVLLGCALMLSVALTASDRVRADEPDQQRLLKQLAELVKDSNQRIAELQKQVAELKREKKIEELTQEMARLRAEL